MSLEWNSLTTSLVRNKKSTTTTSQSPTAASPSFVFQSSRYSAFNTRKSGHVPVRLSRDLLEQHATGAISMNEPALLPSPLSGFSPLPSPILFKTPSHATSTSRAHLQVETSSDESTSPSSPTLSTSDYPPTSGSSQSPPSAVCNRSRAEYASWNTSTSTRGVKNADASPERERPKRERSSSSLNISAVFEGLQQQWTTAEPLGRSKMESFSDHGEFIFPSKPLFNRHNANPFTTIPRSFSKNSFKETLPKDLYPETLPKDVSFHETLPKDISMDTLPLLPERLPKELDDDEEAVAINPCDLMSL